MQIVLRKIEDLKVYEKNARTHSDEQIRELSASIKIYGFLDPIEIGPDLVVIAGHARLRAALQLGLNQVPTLMHSHLDKNARKGYILAANKIAQKAGWDHGILKEEFNYLSDEGFDLLATGFSQEEIDGILTEEDITEGQCDPDECPEVTNSPSVSCHGDVWILGKHRLMCGDSVSIDDVDLLIGNEKIGMVFTDPPYGISIVSKDGAVGGGTKGKYQEVIGDDSIQTAIDAYTVCASLKIPKMIFWGGNYYCSKLPESSCWIVWDKQDGKRVTFADCELAWTNFKEPARLFKHIWDGFRRDSEKGEMRVHPTQKPIQLIEEIFEYFESPKTILDLFGGSGSTLIACEKTNRKCYIMEISEHYCDVIVKRWEKFTGKKAILEKTGEPFNGESRTEV